MADDFDAVKFLMNEAERMAFFDAADEADKFRTAAEEITRLRQRVVDLEQERQDERYARSGGH